MKSLRTLFVRSATLLCISLSLWIAGQASALAGGHTAEPSQEQPVDDAQARFDEAMAALEAEKVYTARRILRDLLGDYPSLHRARLELARADYLARDFDAAEAEILQVLEDPEVPPSVQTTLLAFLAQIRDDRTVFARRHDWSGQLYGGLTWDSNVNYGADDVIDIGGTPFLSEEEEDVGAVIDVGLLHTYNPNRTFEHDEQTGYFLWQTQGNAYYRSYFDETESNLGVLTLRTGPAWVVPEDWRFSIGLQGDQLFYGTENLAFFTSINPQFTKQLTDASGYTLSLTGQERSYDDTENKPRDGRFYRAAFSYDRLLANNVGTQIGVAWADFDADGDQFSYNGPEVFAGVTFEAWERGQVFGRIGYRQFDFEEADPDLPFGVARDEDEWRAIVGFRHQLASTIAKNWTLRGDVIFTTNDSNVPLYDYDRVQVNLGLQKSW